MEILFLGTGTSTGVPRIACNCVVCTSENSKDKRLRSSVLIREKEDSVLIDCGPDFRQQMLTHKINSLSNILLTHEHYDHIAGIDDVRPFGNIKIYAEKRVLGVVKRSIPYCFKETRYPGIPKIQLHEIKEDEFNIGSLKIQPIRFFHASLAILGFRVNNMAYLTDLKTISEASISQLKGLDVLIINALRRKEHISHLSLDEALELIKKINAKENYLTHFSDEIGLYDELNDSLPTNVNMAYDGLVLNI